MSFNGITYIGGKKRIAQDLIDNFPHEHKKMHYVEAFLGGGAVFFKKEPSLVESLNDIDLSIYSLFKALQENFKELEHKLKHTPHHETLWRETFDHRRNNWEGLSHLDRAYYKIVNLSFSFSSIGGAFGYSSYPNSENQLTNFIDNLLLCRDFIEKRLKKVQIFNRDTNRLIETLDSEMTLFYLDPPYPETEQKYKKKYSTEQLDELLEILKTIKGKFALSLQKKPKNLSPDWHLLEFSLPCISNNAIEQTKGKKQVELLVLNYDPKKETTQGSLF